MKFIPPCKSAARVQVGGGQDIVLLPSWETYVRISSMNGWEGLCHYRIKCDPVNTHRNKGSR